MNKINELLEANKAYRAGKPFMSDSAYDAMLDELRATDPDNKFLHTVEPEKSDRLKVKHSAPMLSTEKAYTFAEIEKFISRCETAAAEIGLDVDDIEYIITPKLDGMAAHWDGERLLTRGDGEFGFNISDALCKGILICPDRFGPGEIVIKKSYFNENLTDSYSHPRNFITGNILADELPNEARKAFACGAVRFAHFGFMKTFFGPPDSGKDVLARLKDEEWIASCYEVSDPIDGLVIEVVNPELKKHLGSTSHHHRWQIAFKRKGETATTNVKAIRWQVGRTGVVTPVVEIEPVEISGAKISNVTGHNAEYINNNGIGVGAEIEIIRSGEVIPKIEKVISRAELDFPCYCPACNSFLIPRGPNLICENPDCIAKSCRSKEHFFKTLDIKGFGPAAVEKLATEPLNRFFEKTDVHYYIGFGFGKQQSVNLNQAIQDRKTKSVNPAKFLAAFGIDCLGESTAKKILSKLSIEELLESTSSTLSIIPGIGEVVALSIVYGLRQNLSLIKNIMRHFKFEVAAEPQSGSLKGMSVVFTGTLKTGSRADCEALAMQNSATVQSSLTASTTHLICGAKVGKTKTDKAVKVGAKVLTEAEFLTMLNL
ncbi:BRCT domain-containing protein [Maridesulfovibrio ferrireducens]|uniref:BRCT domain-containing protein n=1 Tax=Maridesulfovibrio ferrireducens TaxID=246191 RepID=UPI001A1C48AB|nr:BRCT domain-containing protein [Maridesulfovibrio ferrireducens]MBI9110017.1 DNA ligase [Maridesulfovibrio ferrireducens]